MNSRPEGMRINYREKNMYDKMGELLEKLAAKLGVTIDHLWVVLVKQVRNQMIAEIIGHIVLLVMTTIFAVFLKNHFKMVRHEDWDWEEHGPTMFCSIASGVLLIVCWIGCFATLDSFLAMINNPEYIALKNVLDMISSD